MREEWKFIFLKEFTRELIINTPFVVDKTIINYDKDKIIEEEFDKVRKELIKQFNLQLNKMNSIKESNEKIIPTFIPSILKEERNLGIVTKNQLPEKITSQYSNVSTPHPIQELQQNKRIQPLSISNPFNEIMKILSDPRVNVLECPGPNKFLLVKTATRVMITRLKLTEEQIRNVIETFSKETKIPIIGGLFKAIKDNLIITAVLSDAAGSRFIIKKVYSQF